MSREAAPCWAIIAIVLLAILGIIASLWYICDRWKPATGPSSGSVPELQVALDLAKDELKAAYRARLEAESTAAAAKTALDAAGADANAPAPDKTAADQPEVAIEKARNAEHVARAHVQDAERALAPDPGKVLAMVAILGTLGGLIHLVTSLVTYVGNRQLLRSWMLYYVTAPFLGASLAPIVYLLVSNSVVGAAAGSGVNTQNLNLTGLYAIAALTGMFARQAAEKLANVFSLIFAKVEARDKLKQRQ